MLINKKINSNNANNINLKYFLYVIVYGNFFFKSTI